jgi:aryl-alcohol dehydrogenase-like predicted oxidoreductase
MEIRELGTSGMMVSTLGFGCWQLGSAGTDDYWGLEYTQEYANKMVDLACGTGTTYFDTAGDYANGASERQLGNAVKTLPEATGKVYLLLYRILPNSAVRRVTSAILVFRSAW